MRPLLKAAEVRELDRRAIHDLGLPGVVLMENAARAITEAVRECLRDASDCGVAILCGLGNNGGDGFAVARQLHQAGVAASVFIVGDSARIGGDARVNLDVLRRLPVPIDELQDEVSEEARGALGSAAVIVDALFGTGLNSDLRGLQRALVELANRTCARRVAVDIPSGVHADTGEVLGVAFDADVTVTFAALKPGLLLAPGSDHAGAVQLADIGIPPQISASMTGDLGLLEWSDALAPFARRPRDGHKGTFGHCLVAAGSPGKGGAALLAGQAALLGGAGLVTIGTDRELQARIEGRIPALMIEWIREDDGDLCDAERLEDLVVGKDAVVIGPGLGDNDSTRSLVFDVIRHTDAPLVIDADGLNVLASHPGALQEANGPCVLTPHPGEMARLLNRTTREIQADRAGAARTLAARESATVVLKGAGTIIASPDGALSLNPTGNPGMGTAGTGDVLAGLLGGLLARGAAPNAAAAAAVYLHGLAGDLAAARRGETALVADDVLAALPDCLRSAERRDPPPTS